jgi:uncharacterized protein (TIGR02246 family)
MGRHLFLSLLIAVLSAFPAYAQQPSAGATAAIKSVLRTHDKAFNDHDLSTIMGLYSQQPNTLLLGTGPGERWVGKAEIQDAYKHFFADFDKGSLTTNCTWTTGEIKGPMAWLAAMCQVTDYLKNMKREYALNLSIVLEQEDGAWHFRAMHFSNLAGGQPPVQN